MTTTRTLITPNHNRMTRTLTHASEITGVGGVARDWGSDLGRPSRIFRVWVNRLSNAHIMDRGMIGQWCNVIVPMTYQAADTVAWNTNLTPAEAAALVGIFESKVYQGRDGYLLTDEHEEFGRAWLASNWDRLWREFNPPDDLHSVDQVLTSDTFRFVGTFTEDGGTWYRPAHVVPMYATRYLAHDGEIRSFVYHWSAWQTERYGR